jgi:hypothetical protein
VQPGTKANAFAIAYATDTGHWSPRKANVTSRPEGPSGAQGARALVVLPCLQIQTYEPRICRPRSVEPAVQNPRPEKPLVAVEGSRVDLL